MAFPLTRIDARGRSLRCVRPPRRIVSLVPSQTELLADLGLDDEVVGLTRFCVHPAGWKSGKAIVGGTKQVDLDRVQALEPDLVLANREENTREMVEALDAIASVYVTDVASLAEACEMIRAVGQLVGREAAGQTLARDVAAAFADLPEHEPVTAAYLIWRAPYMTVGGDTFIHDVMTHVGLANVFADRRRYPEVTARELAVAEPDVVLLASEPYPFTDEHAAEVRAAVGGALVRLVDGEAFSWYGSRLLHAAPYLRQLCEDLLDGDAGASGWR